MLCGGPKCQKAGTLRLWNSPNYLRKTYELLRVCCVSGVPEYLPKPCYTSPYLMPYFSTKLNPLIRAFIISDAMLYSSLNIVNVLFVVYVTTMVVGGTVQSATAALAVGLVARVTVELLS